MSSMIEGSLEIQYPQFQFQNRVEGSIQFPDFKFIIRDRNLTTCEVYQVVNGIEEKVGQSQSQSVGFLFRLKRQETLGFVIGEQELTIVFGAFNNWVIYRGERKKLIFALHIPEEENEDPYDDENERSRKRPSLPEWRSFAIGDLRLEHHDWENHYRVFAPNESDALLIAFVAFRCITQINTG